MKIAYVSRLSVNCERGVLKKVAEQVRQWLAFGQDVRLFALSPVSDVWKGMADIPLDLVISGSRLMPLVRAHTMVKRVLAWQPDLVYLRWGPNYPSLPILMRRVPVVMEINTDDLAEYRVLFSRAKYLYHKMTRGIILRRAAGFVSVTHELAERFSQYGKPAAVISNGIMLDLYSQLPPPENPSPRLVIIAVRQIFDWHGIDKIMWIARRFPEWTIDLIGIGPEDLRTMDLTQSPNVNLHGILGRDDYQRILARVDVGLGTLAAHRKNLNESSSLKVREYLAYGIPTILGNADTDFPEPVPFLLQLPNTPDNVEKCVTEIEGFVKKWQGRRVPREQITHIDIGVKERKRIQFFQEISKSLHPG